MTMEKNRNRVQLFLSDTHKDILNQLREEKGWNELRMPDKEVLKYIILDYQRLSEDYRQLKEKLTYMDQNISVILQLVSSMAMIQHIEDYPLSDSLPYFQARKHVESLMNYPRGSIQPSPAIQKELQEPTKRWDEKAFTEKPKTSSVSIPESKPVKNQRDETEEMPNYFL